MNKSEVQTRSELIDLQLAPSGWDFKDNPKEVEGFNTLTKRPDDVSDAFMLADHAQSTLYLMINSIPSSRRAMRALSQHMSSGLSYG